MVKRKTFAVLLLVFVLVVVFFNLFTVYLFGIPLSPVAITGRAIEDTGLVSIIVQGVPRAITIYTPQNTTYDNTSYTCSGVGHPKCDDYRYILPLNVSADFNLENNSDWRYSLYDLVHGVYVEEDIIFTPNTSVSFVAGVNLLTVFAEEKDADWVNQSVIFTIDIPNSAPLIQNFSDKIFVCEGERINSLNESYFNVFDIDEEDFVVSGVDYVIDGSGVFALFHSAKTSNYITPLQIRSLIFGKTHLTDYIKTITVKDSYDLTDTNTTNISVVEINNVPVLYVDGVVKSGGIGAQTVWMSGADSVFIHQMEVVDTEDGSSDDGNLVFNLSGDPGFTLNVSTGDITYVPQEGDQGGGESKTYGVTICATDNNLTSVHENFSICSDRGYSADNQSVCDSFSLTVTEKNRAPSIDSYSPENLSFSVSGTSASSFNVTVSDPDMVGSYPDIDWYVDDALVEENENKSSDNFSYTFGCDVSGAHTVKIVTSDGLLNDSVTWNISVINVDCPEGFSGGGGAFGRLCNEQWSCLSWGLCQNAERSFNAEALSSEDYSSTRDLCAQNLINDEFCGFQITNCFDLEMCNNTEIRVPKPSESRVCYFTEDPNCLDGITNCHDGDCELLVDCGGPCDPCPTCSDGERNQGENGVDCGGPCPYACEGERPFGRISYALIGLFSLLFLILIYILYKIFKIVRHKFFLAGKGHKKKDER